MKRIVQDTGIRKYYGDDFLTIQDEAMTIWEGMFGQFGDFIISGLNITDNGDGTYNISSGLVMLDGKVRRFYGATNVNLPIYLIAAEQTTSREYLYGGVKPAIVEYLATYQTTQPVGVNYMTINPTGNRTWRDAIQDSAYRMVTDALINAWNSHINSTSNPHNVTPAQIGAATTGLDNVADTTILNKLKNVDGTGSGLDADMLRGNPPDAFVRRSGDTISGNLTITGSNGDAIYFNNSNNVAVILDIIFPAKGGIAADQDLFLGSSNGYIRFVKGQTSTSTQLGYIDPNAVIHLADFQLSSDRRLKTDIGELPDINIEQLHPVRFRFKDSDNYQYGFIAQELLQVLPELVRQNEEGYYEISYISLIAILTKEIQKLKKEVDGLKNSLTPNTRKKD